MALASQYVEKEHYTEAEYFEYERTSVGRWEYVSGQIRLMSGGTAYHGGIGMNIGRALGNVLVPRGCWVFGGDVRVHTGDGVNTFPDVSVVCGDIQFYLGKTDTVLNPVLVVEVLSPSTEAYERTEKFKHYQAIETLQEYLLVEQDEARVLLYTRREDRWEPREVSGRTRSIALASVDVTLALTDVYALVKFSTEQK